FYGGILLSPQGRGMMGLVDGSWDTVSKPLLAVTGQGDAGQDPNVKIEPFALSAPNNKHLAWFSKISSTIYSGQQIRPNTVQQLVYQDLLAVTTAFLTAYGNFDAEVLAELAGDYYTRMSDQRIRMLYR